MNVNTAHQSKFLARFTAKYRIKPAIWIALGVLLVLFVVTWLNLSWRPDVSALPPDSGFYAYIGKAILHGQVLYRDVWDDKPPFGYYLNALSQAIFGQTPFGVWWSGVIWITGCVLLFFFVIKRLFGGVPALISSMLFLIAVMNPQLFQGGNMMEIYALAPQVGIIGVTSLYFNHRRAAWYSCLVGVLTAAAYLVKPPTVVLGCAAILVIAVSSLRQWNLREALISILAFGLGCAGLVGLTSLYWLVIGSFSNFIDGAILQGFSFIGGPESRLSVNFFYTLIKILPTMYIGNIFLLALWVAGIFLIIRFYRIWLKPIFLHGLSWLEWCLAALVIIVPAIAIRLLHGSHSKIITLAAIACLALLFMIKYYRLPARPSSLQVFSPLEWTWLIGVVALPLELLMASLGGRNFGHYFTTMIPTIFLVLAYPLWKMVNISKQELAVKWPAAHIGVYTIFVALLLVWGISSFIPELPPKIDTDNLTGIFRGQYLKNDLVKYIIQTTQPNDEVLVWHIHLGINFVADRKAPSRFLFPLNLFIPPSNKNTRLKEYIDDLEENPPELIVVQNASSIALPFVDQPTDQACQVYCTPEFVQAIRVPQINQQWLRLQDYFYSHYALDTRIYDWKVYRRLP